MKKTVISFTAIGGMALLVFLSSVHLGWPHLYGSKLIKTYESPFMEHKLEIWAYNYLVSMPGDSAPGPGFAIIKNKNNHILLKRSVDSVLEIEVPEWTINSVEFERLGKWDFSE